MKKKGVASIFKFNTKWRADAMTGGENSKFLTMHTG